MRVPSGTTDRYVYFVAVDSTDLKTRETGLSSFTVYRSRNGAAAAAMSSPTVNETDSTNMAGVYELLLDEDTTLAAGNDSEEMVLHITASGMAPVTRSVEIYRPETTEGSTLAVADVASILADTNEIQGDLANGGRLDLLIDSIISKVDVIDGIVDDVLVDTAVIGAAGAGLTDLGGMSTTMKGQVNTEADTALSDYDPPTKAEMDSAFSTTDGKVDVVDGIVDSILLDTAEIGAAGAGLTAVVWNSSWDAEVQSECTDALNAYDPPTKAEMDGMWTTAQTESYASDGAAATPAQLLYMILCSVSEFAISGTTITGKKLDGSTTAMTWTISDSSNPTSRTRAS